MYKFATGLHMYSDGSAESVTRRLRIVTIATLVR